MKHIIYITGLFRCGSSLLCQQFHASNYKVAGNYPMFEDKRTLQLENNHRWLLEYRGGAVKLLAPHTNFPPFYKAHVIYLSRNPTEQALSMLKWLDEFHKRPKEFTLEKAIESVNTQATYAEHASRLLACKGKFMHVTYEQLKLESWHTLERIAKTLKLRFDIPAMIQVRRNTHTKCLGKFLEYELKKEQLTSATQRV